MEASKIGFSTIDNTAFEGKKKKVKKEHPKREKIKENAKRMALFLAGLATLGIATVAITAKDTKEKPVIKEKEEIKDETPVKEDDPAPQDEKITEERPKKEDDTSKKAVFHYQKALPAPKKVYMLPEHSILDTLKAEEGANEDIKDVQGEPAAAEKISSKTPVNTDNASLIDGIDKLLKQIATLEQAAGAEVSDSSHLADESSDYKKVQVPGGDLEAFLDEYEAQEAEAATRQQKGFQEQLAKVSDMLDDSIAHVEEDLPPFEFDTSKLISASGEAQAESQLSASDYDIEAIVSEMLLGSYGKNAQNAVQYHLDEKAYEIYKGMNPITVHSLPNHFIEMTISKDAMGNSDKGKLKRLAGLEKKFTPDGICKITSTPEGRQRLLRYVIGIEYVNHHSLSGDMTLAEKLSDMQKTILAKKENMDWLMKAAKA